MLLVKVRGLKTERVQMNAMTPPAAGFFFGLLKDLAAITLPAYRFIQPQDADMQPSPIRFAILFISEYF